MTFLLKISYVPVSVSVCIHLNVFSKRSKLQKHSEKKKILQRKEGATEIGAEKMGGVAGY